MRALVLAAAAATLTACGSSEPEAPPAAAPADELTAVVEPLEATPEVIEESAAMSTMNGTVTYLMRRALHPEAVIRVRLEDISRADAPATVLAETRVEAAGRSDPHLARDRDLAVQEQAQVAHEREAEARAPLVAR